MSNVVFQRPELASMVVERLSSNNVFATPTCFLAAPRRTGKSTFLQQDLKPALEKAGFVVVYVDLWRMPEKDPGLVLKEALYRELKNHASLLEKKTHSLLGMGRRLGIKNISVPGAAVIDVSLPTSQEDLTGLLSDFFSRSQKRVVFIIDEAQSVISSPNGMNTMFALKSARDTLNSPGVINFGLVMAGSDRDKLLRLVNGNAAPFLGSHIENLPLLDAQFVDFVLQNFWSLRPEWKSDVFPLNLIFQNMGCRPEPFIQILRESLLLPPLTSVKDWLQNLEQRSAQAKVHRIEQYTARLSELTALQRAIVEEIMLNGSQGALFSSEALKRYQAYVGREVSAGNARDALEKLRSHQEPLVWKSYRGEYAVEDSGMRDWFLELHKNQAWPPEDLRPPKTRKPRKSM